METKERILNNALNMFAKSGYNAVSIRDIAKCICQPKIRSTAH